MAKPGPDDNYYAAVESYFVERRGSPLFITPGEWQLVLRWEQDGIPLDVVKDGIDLVFERPKARLKPRKLSYCRQTVEAQFRRFRELRLGGRPKRSDDEHFDAALHLEGLVSTLADIDETFRASLASETARASEALRQLAVELRETKGPRSKLESVEEHLQLLEDGLVARAERVVSDSVKEELKRESESSLGAYRERMPDKVYVAALRSAYRRRLRKRVGLARLSLFDR